MTDLDSSIVKDKMQILPPSGIQATPADRMVSGSSVPGYGLPFSAWPRYNRIPAQS